MSIDPLHIRFHSHFLDEQEMAQHYRSRQTRALALRITLGVVLLGVAYFTVVLALGYLAR